MKKEERKLLEAYVKQCLNCARAFDEEGKWAYYWKGVAHGLREAMRMLEEGEDNEAK